jgi:hypothetical protein
MDNFFSNLILPYSVIYKVVRAICTDVTHGADMCPTINVASRRPQSCQSNWCDWVAPPAMAWLTAHSSKAACPLVASEQTTQLTHDSPVDTTGVNLNRTAVFLPPLSLLSFFLLALSALSHDRRLSFIRRRRLPPSSHRSWCTTVLILPEGSSPLLTE